MAHPLDTQDAYRNFYKNLIREFSTVQFVICNTTDAPERIRLWGANSNLSVTTTEQFANRFNQTTTVTTDNYPQGITYNPANELFYVVNQLSDSITVFTSEGSIVETILLNTTPFATAYSPIAITVNTNQQSPHFGEIYVLSTIRDSVSMINLLFEVTLEIFITKRPTSFVYNSIDDSVYVTGITESSLFVIDVNRDLIRRDLEGIPVSIGLDNDSGNVFIHLVDLNEVYVYDINHNRLAIVSNAPRSIISWAYHPLNRKIYGVFQDDPSIFVIDTENFTSNRVAIAGIGLSIAYSPSEGLIYIGETTGQISRLDAQDQFIAPYPVADFETGIAIHPITGVVALSQATRNTVTIVSVDVTDVTIKENYDEYRQEFQFNPAHVKHLKIISSDRLITTLELEDISISGKSDRRFISIGNYNSPQNFLNVAEVFEIEGTVIDGLHQWYFTLAAQTTITLLIYYSKLDWFNVLENQLEVHDDVESQTLKH